MPMMRNIVFTLLAAISLLAAGAAVAAQPLKVGISAEPYPPFTYKSASGDWTGFEVDLGQAICERIERECVTTPTAWSGIIPALNSGKIDMIMNSMTITREREKMVAFSKPYYKTGWAYVGPKSMDIDIPDGLAGKIVGIQSATTAAKHARKVLAGVPVRIKYYPKQEQLNRDLLAHRVDLMFADDVAMYQFVKRDEAANYEVKKDIETQYKGVGVVMRKADKNLISAVNKAVSAVHADGTCTQLSEKYFGMDICTDD